MLHSFSAMLAGFAINAFARGNLLTRAAPTGLIGSQRSVVGF